MMKSFYTLLAVGSLLLLVAYTGLYYFDMLPTAGEAPVLDSFERVWHIDTLKVDTNIVSEPTIPDTIDL